MKNRIVWKLTACFAAVLLLFTAMLGAVFVSMFRKHAIAINRSAMEEKALSIADTLASFETEGLGGMEHGGTGGYGAYLRFLNQLTMAEVWIVDENLYFLTPVHGRSASYAQLPKHAEEIVRRVFQGEVTYGEEFSGLLDGASLTVGAPIRTSLGITGAVLLHSPASGVNEAVLQGLSALAAGAVVALLFSGVAAFWLSYRFTAPLRRMKTAALRLANGDYAAETGVAQTDEIGQLAHTIDFLSDRLAQTEKERAALDQLKQDFVANVSHELRTPVAVLRGSLEVLLDGTVNKSEEIWDYYRQMLDESRHLERLVNDLLDLSRLQDAQFRLEMNEVNLCDVVRDTARAIRRSTQEKGLDLFVSCPEKECLAKGDYGRIRQLLLILLDNAVKFSIPPGKVQLVLSQHRGDYLVAVINQGKDIPSGELPHLFDRFYKTPGPDNRSGTGLGLAIAKQIADRHKADLLVKSGEGQTLFSIRFTSIAK
ncbi:sensor histidine kinase [Lacrimispora brassicae]